MKNKTICEIAYALMLQDYEVHVGNQDIILERIDDYGEFPMISFEKSQDSPFSVSVNESKFINDPIHDGVWMIGEKDGYNAFILNLKDYGNDVEIDAFEVNASMRRQGIAGTVVRDIEETMVSEGRNLVLTPFDSDAESFWLHMGYEWKNGMMVNDLHRVLRKGEQVQ